MNTYIVKRTANGLRLFVDFDGATRDMTPRAEEDGGVSIWAVSHAILADALPAPDPQALAREHGHDFKREFLHGIKDAVEIGRDEIIRWHGARVLR